MKIAIIGASGCIGKNLLAHLAQDENNVITASFQTYEKLPNHVKSIPNVTWKTVDLNDINSIQKFLDKSETLIYLVHSLDKKGFENLDNLYADNTAEAVTKSTIKKMIYMGGIIPQDEDLSEHLKSRMETGVHLSKSKIPLVEIRASIVIGSCSSSFNIIYNLAKKFPFLIGPTTLNSLCTPIYIDDVVKFISKMITTDFKDSHKVINIGSAPMKYSELVSATRNVLFGKNLKIITIPNLPTSILARIYSLIYRQDTLLVSHLFESLKNNTITDDSNYVKYAGSHPISVNEAIKNAGDAIKGNNKT